MTVDELEFYDEIDCGDLSEENNSRERIVIFQLYDTRVKRSYLYEKV